MALLGQLLMSTRYPFLYVPYLVPVVTTGFLIKRGTMIYNMSGIIEFNKIICKNIKAYLGNTVESAYPNEIVRHW